MNWPRTTTAAATAVAVAANPAPRTNILLARAVALAVAAALLATAMFAAGCKNGGASGAGSAGGVGAARGSSESPAGYGTLVKSGPSPLNYRLGPAGTLRVVDTSADNAVVATAAVPASTTVNVDDVKGI
jgi:hypothetical protein